MNRIVSPTMITCASVLFALFCLSCSQQASKPVEAEKDAASLTVLLDKVQIEEMLTRYYVDLTSGSSHDLSEYYTEDAVFYVNGQNYEGRRAIEELYAGFEGDEANLGSKMHMLLSNPIIDVSGDTATAWVIWTGIMNEEISKPPRLVEQGREYDELVKRDGRWYFKKRSITADSGLPDIFADTYEPRKYR